MFNYKDIRAFLGTLRKAGIPRKDFYYWRDAAPKNLAALEDHLGNPEDPERKLIRRILSDKKSTTLLDAGCGSATELRGYRINGLAIEYTGLDRQSAMFDFARKNFSTDQQAHFVEGDINNLPFKDGSFDTVLLKHVLEHQQFYEGAVEEAIRVAKKTVVINLYQRLLPTPFDIPLWNRNGFWNNWYSRSKFESYLVSLDAGHFEQTFVSGISGQTAEIYVIDKC